MSTGRFVAMSVVVCTFACGTAPARPRARPDRPTAPTVLAVHARATMLGGAGIDLGEVEPGAMGGLAGGHRLRWRAREHVEVAQDVIAAGIVGAVRHADGWRFADRRGDVWSSASFLGPVTHAGTLGIRHFEIVPARGTIAVLAKNRTRALLTSDGRAAAREACAFPVLSAAYADARHALVVADGGGLFHTADGGATWIAVAPADGPFVAVDLAEDGFVAYARDADARLTSRHVSLAGLPSDATLASTSQPPDDGRLRAGLLALATADAFLSFPSTALLDGRIAVAPWGERGMRVDLATGHGAPIRSLPADCGLHAWGTRVLAICADGARVGDGRTFRRTTRIAGARTATAHVASEDGRTVAWVEQVPSSSEELLVVLVRPEDGTRYARRIRSETLELRAVHETTVLITGRDPGVRVLDVSSDREHRLDVPGTLLGARIDAQGHVFVSAIAGESGERPSAVLLRGRVDSPTLERVTTPPRALVAGLVDARNGAAVGETAAEVYTTSDGGLTWQPIALAPGDEAALVRLGVMEQDRPFFCDRTRCVVAPTRERPGVVLLFGSAPVSAPARLRVASDDVPLEPVDSGAREPILGCEMEPVADERGRPLPTGSFATATSTGRVVVRRTTRASSIEITWSGRDARGAYRARARATTPAPSPLTTSPASDTEPSAPSSPPTVGPRAGGPFRVRAAWATRHEVLFDLCGEDGTCESLRARAGGAVVPFPHAMAPIASSPDGAMLGITARASAVEVRAIRGDDASTLRRFELPDAESFGLTLTAQPALVARTPSGRWRLYPLDASSPPRAFPNVPEALAVCAGPPLPDAIAVRWPGGPALDGRPARATTIELSPESACVRSVEIAPDDAEPVTFRGVLEATTGGALEGPLVRRVGAVGTETLVRESRARRFRCRLTTP
ncbi:MAG: hypothetical protein IT379_31440 [Deltaproteobacteria bacterium]|nr:hypothetical protein [Deltaproteobacteria bacterium]